MSEEFDDASLWAGMGITAFVVLAAIVLSVNVPLLRVEVVALALVPFGVFSIAKSYMAYDGALYGGNA